MYIVLCFFALLWMSFDPLLCPWADFGVLLYPFGEPLDHFGRPTLEYRIYLNRYFCVWLRRCARIYFLDKNRYSAISLQRGYQNVSIFRLVSIFWIRLTYLFLRIYFFHFGAQNMYFCAYLLVSISIYLVFMFSKHMFSLCFCVSIFY